MTEFVRITVSQGFRLAIQQWEQADDIAWRIYNDRSEIPWETQLLYLKQAEAYHNNEMLDIQQRRGELEAALKKYAVSNET